MSPENEWSESDIVWSCRSSIQEEDWDSLMATNLRGAFFVAQEAANRMADPSGHK